jgi:hypothetical protein
VQLIGSHGESDKFAVGNSEDEGIERGSKVTFDVQVPPIGPIRRVLVEREKASCTATGDGWFLEAVVVQGPNGEHYSFPCNAWFGHSDCGDYEGGPVHGCSSSSSRCAGSNTSKVMCSLGRPCFVRIET